MRCTVVAALALAAEAFSPTGSQHSTEEQQLVGGVVPATNRSLLSMADEAELDALEQSSPAQHRRGLYYIGSTCTCDHSIGSLTG